MNKTPLTLESAKSLKQGDTLIVYDITDLRLDTMLKIGDTVEFVKHDIADIIEINVNDKTVGPMGYYYWRFALPSREKLTLEVAQLLPKGTMLEAAEPFNREFKQGDCLEFVECFDAIGTNYVKIITPNNPTGGGFYPEQFYMPEIKEDTEAYHMIKIAEHTEKINTIKNARKEQYTAKLNDMFSRHDEEIRELKKEYGIK